MKQHEIEAERNRLERAEGIVMGHLACSQGRTVSGLRVGTTNSVVGRNGGRLEIVLDTAEAEAFAAWLETRVKTER